MTCCRFTDPEIVEQESEQFDCGACEVAAQMASLDLENREAWSIYRACCNRFLVDTNAVPVLLAKIVEDWDAEQVTDLTERMRVIYDIVQPRKQS